MKLRKNKKALAAVAVVAFATHPGKVRAEDITVEIHELKEAVKQLEPLKARIKQLEAEVAKEKHERKEAQGPVHNAAAQPGPGPGPGPVLLCKDAPCPPPPLPVFVSFTNGLKVESADGDFSFRIGGRVYVDGGISSQPAPALVATKALPALAAVPANGFANQVGIRQARLQAEARHTDSGTIRCSMISRGRPTILL